MKFRNLFLVLTLVLVSFTIMGVTRKKTKLRLRTKAYPVLSISDRKLIAIENSSAIATSAKFSYDALGNLSRVEFDGMATEYQVAGDTLNAFTLNTSKNKRTEFFAGDFAEKGYLNEYSRWYILSGDTVRSFGKFEYNDQGYLEKQTVRFNSGDEYEKLYTYAQDDLVSVQIFKNKKPVSTTTWQYTGNIDHVKIDFSRFYDAALNITGPASKHLPAHKLVVNPKGVVQLDESYTYELDAEGYVMKRMTTSGNNAFAAIEEKFLYQ